MSAAPPISRTASPTSSPTARRRATSAAVVVLFLLASAILAWAWTSTRASSAAFADSEVFDDNHLGAGTVDIALGEGTVDFTAVNMAAGDVATGQLELLNNGTLALRYTLSASSNGVPLGDALDLVAWTGAPGCSQRPVGADELWRPLIDVEPGTETTTETSNDATPAFGRLAPGESRLVCLAGNLPLSAPNSIQGQQLVVRLTAHAEHDLDATGRADPGRAEQTRAQENQDGAG